MWGKPRPVVGGSCLPSWFQAQPCLLNRAHSAEELPAQGQGRKAQGGKQMRLCWGALPSPLGSFEGWRGAQEEAGGQPWRAPREEEARRRRRTPREQFRLSLCLQQEIKSYRPGAAEEEIKLVSCATYETTLVGFGLQFDSAFPKTEHFCKWPPSVALGCFQGCRRGAVSLGSTSAS